MEARITPHSPLPKGKKLVLGNMGYKELLTWERNATGSECVGKPPGRKTMCDMGSRTSEEDVKFGKLRQAVCTSKEEKTRGEERRWWPRSQAQSGKGAGRGAPIVGWPGSSRQVDYRYHPTAPDLLGAGTHSDSKSNQQDTNQGIKNTNPWIVEVPEFYLISFTMNTHPQHCLKVRQETHHSRSYLCEAHPQA